MFRTNAAPLQPIALKPSTDSLDSPDLPSAHKIDLQTTDTSTGKRKDYPATRSSQAKRNKTAATPDLTPITKDTYIVKSVFCPTIRSQHLKILTALQEPTTPHPRRAQHASHSYLFNFCKAESAYDNTLNSYNAQYIALHRANLFREQAARARIQGVSPTIILPQEIPFVRMIDFLIEDLSALVSTFYTHEQRLRKSSDSGNKSGQCICSHTCQEHKFTTSSTQSANGLVSSNQSEQLFGNLAWSQSPYARSIVTFVKKLARATSSADEIVNLVWTEHKSIVATPIFTDRLGLAYLYMITRSISLLLYATKTITFQEFFTTKITQMYVGSCKAILIYDMTNTIIVAENALKSSATAYMLPTLKPLLTDVSHYLAGYITIALEAPLLLSFMEIHKRYKEHYSASATTHINSTAARTLSHLFQIQDESLDSLYEQVTLQIHSLETKLPVPAVLVPPLKLKAT